MAKDASNRGNGELAKLRTEVKDRMEQSREAGRLRILNPWLCVVQTAQEFEDFKTNDLDAYLKEQAVARQARVAEWAGEPAVSEAVVIELPMRSEMTPIPSEPGLPVASEQ